VPLGVDMPVYRPLCIRWTLSLALSIASLSLNSLELLAQQDPASSEAAGGVAQAAESSQSPAASESAGASAEPFPELTIPADADIEQLEVLIERAKAVKPRTPHQYQLMQTAIRDGSKQLVKLLRESGAGLEKIER